MYLKTKRLLKCHGRTKGYCICQNECLAVIKKGSRIKCHREKRPRIHLEKDNCGDYCLDYSLSSEKCFVGSDCKSRSEKCKSKSKSCHKKRKHHKKCDKYGSRCGSRCGIKCRDGCNRWIKSYC